MESAETSSAPTAERILEAARLRLAAGGFRDLTLRPLAEASGSTVAALTYHFGSKRALIERLVQAERQADGARHAAFLARFAGLRALAPAALVALLEHYLDEAAGRERVTSLIWCELLLAAVGDPEARELVAPWIAERRAFWDAVFEGRIDDPQAWALACLGYVTDETAHGLAQQDSPDYRLMRAMTLERLAGRGASLGLSEPAFFEAVVRRLDPALALPGPASQAPYAGRALDIAMAAGEVIVARGAEGVTHRAVGERAQAPASSVAYHFRTRLDLLRPGPAGAAPGPGRDRGLRRPGHGVGGPGRGPRERTAPLRRRPAPPARREPASARGRTPGPRPRPLRRPERLGRPARRHPAGPRRGLAAAKRRAGRLDARPRDLNICSVERDF